MSEEWNGKSVLIVDDSHSVQLDLEQVFKKIGMNVVGICSNGLEALESYKELKPDLISLDIIMPVMDGIECYKRLKNNEHNLKFVFISCLSSNPAAVAAFEEEVPAYHFIPKPATEELVKEKLTKLFSNK